MFLPIARVIICFISVCSIIIIKYLNIQTVFIILAWLGIVYSFPYILFSYQYKNNKTIVKRFVGIKIKELEITSHSKFEIYRYWNRRKFLEDNQEEYSDKYYKLKISNDENNITVLSLYRNTKLLSIMDYLPSAFIRKAKFIKNTNWIKLLSK